MSITIKGTRQASPSLFSEFVRRDRASSGAEHVERRKIPYWREQGWVYRGGVYHGAYRTQHGSFQGTVEDRGFGDLRFYMIGPPRAVRHSSHWACFAPRGNKGFQVHMGYRPKDVSSGIMTIERLITEASENQRRW